jgi:hypothetical protein
MRDIERKRGAKGEREATIHPRGSVVAVAVPVGSLADAVPFHDYRDAFRMAIDPERFPTVDAFARAFVSSPPLWIQGAMRVRDAVVGVFGMKRAGDLPPTAMPERYDVGAMAGIFRVYARTDRELLAGEDDRHLDFRISIFHEESSVTVSTLVFFHNLLGRAYFIPVAPMHRLIVPMMMRAALEDRTRPS